jgi:hypothetical protein
MAARSMQELEAKARMMDELVARDLPTYYNDSLYDGIFKRVMEVELAFEKKRDDGLK